jgi:heme A synthase
MITRAATLLMILLVGLLCRSQTADGQSDALGEITRVFNWRGVGLGYVQGDSSNGWYVG